VTLPKISEKEEAIKLRATGKTYREIQKILHVSKGSLSLWLKSKPRPKRNIEAMTQRAIAAGRIARMNFASRRMIWREEGRKKAQEKDYRHAVGCSLYWAEGAKGRHGVKLANTDEKLIYEFVDFLRVSVGVEDKDIKVEVSVHEDGECTGEECELFWASYLGLNGSAVKSFRNKDKRPRTGLKKNRHKHGMAIVLVHKTSVIQHIYGAIEEYFGASFHKIDSSLITRV
jgi:hypothetical protein